MTPALIFQGTVSGFKRAIDLIKGINNLTKATEIAAVKIELQQIILDAQEAQFTLTERVRELEKELADLKTWDAEKERYTLANWKHGVMAYVPKEPMQSAEAAHALCTNCYAEGKKSVLQAVKLLSSYRISCASCHSEILTSTAA